MKSVIVGGTLKEAAARVADAWKRASQGEAFEAEDNVTFVSWSALSAVMTDKRHALLQRLHAQSAPSIRELARRLDRDFKRVHQDVAALERVGLIERDDDGSLTANYSQIQATIQIEPRAA